MTKNVTRLAAAAFVAGAMSLGAVAPAFADNPTVLGLSKDWSAYTVGSGDNKVCYAASQPKSSSPKKKRDPIYFLINDWPARRARAEPEIVPGYKFKEDSTVTVQVGSDTYTFVIKNGDQDGTAWLKSTLDEQHLIDSMQRNSEMIVTGVSARGSMIHDTYSLAGLGDAITKIHAGCGM
jgi:hypothetical protein